jgi:hypothetical protein
MAKIKIDPSKDYNLNDIVRNGFMGKGKSYFVCKNIVTDELWKPLEERVLKATKTGEGRNAYYFIKGKNLLEYLKINK